MPTSNAEELGLFLKCTVIGRGVFGPCACCVFPFKSDFRASLRSRLFFRLVTGGVFKETLFRGRVLGLRTRDKSAVALIYFYFAYTVLLSTFYNTS